MFLVYYGAAGGARPTARSSWRRSTPSSAAATSSPSTAGPMRGAGGSPRAARGAAAALGAVRRLPRPRRPHRHLLPGARARSTTGWNGSTRRSSTARSPSQLERDHRRCGGELVALRRVVTPQRDLLARGIDDILEIPGLRGRLARLLPRRLRPRDPDLRPDRLLPRPARRQPRRLPLGRLQPAQPDHQAADGGGDDLPAALLRRRLLRPELQWLVTNIDSAADFLVLGIGSLVLSVIGAAGLVPPRLLPLIPGSAGEVSIPENTYAPLVSAVTRFRGALLRCRCSAAWSAPRSPAARCRPERRTDASRARLARLASPALRAASPAAPGGAPRRRRAAARAASSAKAAASSSRSASTRGAIAAARRAARAGAQIVSASRRYQTVTVAVAPADLPDAGRSSRRVGGLAEPRRRSSTARPPRRRRRRLRRRRRRSPRASTSCTSPPPAKPSASRQGRHGRHPLRLLRLATEAADGSGPDRHPRRRRRRQRRPARAAGDLQRPAGSRSTSSTRCRRDVGEDEGRAMLQIVHDLAPHAALAFATAFGSEESFAHNIEALARPVAEGGAGAKVIVDDVAYFEEPFFQDGPVAVAVNKVTAEGVTYLSAAGNDNLFEAAGNAGEHRLLGSAGIPRLGSCPTAVDCRDRETWPVQGLNPALHGLRPRPRDEDDTFGITVEAGANSDRRPAVGGTLERRQHRPRRLPARRPAAKVVARLSRSQHRQNRDPEAGRAGSSGKTRIRHGAGTCTWRSTAAPAPATRGLKRRRCCENGGGVSCETEYPNSSEGDVVGPTIFGHAGAASAITRRGGSVQRRTQPERYSSRGPGHPLLRPVEGWTPPARSIAAETIAKPDARRHRLRCDHLLRSLRRRRLALLRHLGGGTARRRGRGAAACRAGPSAPAADRAKRLTESAAPVGRFGADAVGCRADRRLGRARSAAASSLAEDGPEHRSCPPLEPEEPNRRRGQADGAAASADRRRRAASTSILRTRRKLVRTRKRARPRRLPLRLRPGRRHLPLQGRRRARSRLSLATLVRMLGRGQPHGQGRGPERGRASTPTPAVFRFRVDRVL